LNPERLLLTWQVHSQLPKLMTWVRTYISLIFRTGITRPLLVPDSKSYRYTTYPESQVRITMWQYLFPTDV
jgi:hypothetical protein